MLRLLDGLATLYIHLFIKVIYFLKKVCSKPNNPNTKKSKQCSILQHKKNLSNTWYKTSMKNLNSTWCKPDNLNMKQSSNIHEMNI